MPRSLKVRDLAGRAGVSEQARSSLAGVTSIDGIPVDMTVILDGTGSQVAERLDVVVNLLGQSSGGPWDADRVRNDATRILSDPRLAGTVVTVESRRAGRVSVPTARRDLSPLTESSFRPGDAVQAELWDVSQVTAEEVALLMQFLRRRKQLGYAARSRHALNLAKRIEDRVVRLRMELPAEASIEQVIAIKDER